MLTQEDSKVLKVQDHGKAIVEHGLRDGLDLDTQPTPELVVSALVEGKLIRARKRYPLEDHDNDFESANAYAKLVLLNMTDYDASCWVAKAMLELKEVQTDDPN